VAELREGIREKVTQIVECNLWNEKPIPACTATTFDVVSSAFCAECIDSSPENYRMFLKRLTSYLRPGGTLLLTALENATEYRVGESWFPACPLTLEQLQAEVRALGFSPRDARRVPAEHAQGYDGLLAVRAEAS
jgi:cyclopropane fatty-acyl-phospholipid synthase-like methyltransferase